MSRLTRRELLVALPALAGCGWLWSGCGEEGAVPEGPLDTTGWIALPLAEYPMLRERGGHVEVERPERLVNAYVVALGEGAYAAAWRICTHGACALDYRPQPLDLWCYCHGSVFGLDGHVHQGPATQPLPTLRVTLRDDIVWLEPPGLS